MPALKALRALIAILGLLALVSGESAAAFAAAEATVRPCYECQKLEPGDPAKQVGTVLSPSSITQSGPDEGEPQTSPEAASGASFRFASVRTPVSSQPSGCDGARLDRPPKSV